MKASILACRLPIAAVALVIFVSTCAAQKPSQPVTVTNTDSNPLPVTGNVGVIGTANVNVTNTPSVTVNGTALVRNVDDPARNAFAVFREYDVPSGSADQTFFVATVPAGKRLVIETVETGTNVPSGQSVIFNLNTSLNSQTITHLIAVAAQGNIPTIGDTWVGTHAVRWYTDSGADVTVRLRRSSSAGGAFIGVTLSGYLVDLGP